MGKLLREGQVDSGFFQGTALLGGVLLAVQASTEQQRERALSALLRGYRACGLEHAISDRRLVEDYIRKNCAAAINVIYASPTFYFLFAKTHGQTFLVSTIRAFTGSLRIVPFMGFFYGSFALVCPFVTEYFMRRGQSYADAQGSAGIAVLLSGFVVVEAVVELRGCGVTFGQMNAASFLLFLPALVGRRDRSEISAETEMQWCAHAPFCPPG